MSTEPKDKGYLISTRAIKIEWDNGRQTVLITSLPKSTVDASEIVGKRIVPQVIRDDYERYGKKIRRHQQVIKTIESAHKEEFKKLT